MKVLKKYIIRLKYLEDFNDQTYWIDEKDNIYVTGNNDLSDLNDELLWEEIDKNNMLFAK